ncbi:hypothetical protein HAX54_029009, partial [Datura stramonium]|nr:hypothetical protein [Datura stramonium]
TTSASATRLIEVCLAPPKWASVGPSPLSDYGSLKEIKIQKYCYISNTPDRLKDLCPSPTFFQSTSENLGFLSLESSMEEWAYAGSISQEKQPPLRFDTQAARPAKEDRFKEFKNENSFPYLVYLLEPDERKLSRPILKEGDL